MKPLDKSAEAPIEKLPIQDISYHKKIKRYFYTKDLE
jgi:hypothetical protein